jgi:hypothetical protein
VELQATIRGGHPGAAALYLDGAQKGVYAALDYAFDFT